jgi:hypothetical protein
LAQNGMDGVELYRPTASLHIIRQPEFMHARRYLGDKASGVKDFARHAAELKEQEPLTSLSFIFSPGWERSNSEAGYCNEPLSLCCLKHLDLYSHCCEEFTELK